MVWGDRPTWGVEGSSGWCGVIDLPGGVEGSSGWCGVIDLPGGGEGSWKVRQGGVG